MSLSKLSAPQAGLTGLTGNTLTGEMTFGTQLLAFSSENIEFPVQGVGGDVIAKILPCFEISKCVRSSATKKNKNIYVVKSAT